MLPKQVERLLEKQLAAALSERRVEGGVELLGGASAVAVVEGVAVLVAPVEREEGALEPALARLVVLDLVDGGEPLAPFHKRVLHATPPFFGRRSLTGTQLERIICVKSLP